MIVPECTCPIGRRRMACYRVTELYEGRERVLRLCSDCRGYRPLGPSNDTCISVIVEMRAVELAELEAPAETSVELQGFDAHTFERDRFTGQPYQSAMEWNAGWLAAAIFTHIDDDAPRPG